MLAEGQSSILGMGLSDNSVDKSGRTETEWMQDVLLCSAAEGAQCQFFVSVEPEPCFASSLEKEMTTYSSTLAWKIPWMEKPGSLQSTGLQRVLHDRATSLSLSLSITILVRESKVPNWKARTEKAAPMSKRKFTSLPSICRVTQRSRGVIWVSPFAGVSGAAGHHQSWSPRTNTQGAGVEVSISLPLG